MALFQNKAVKEKLHARVALDGPTGSGKTWTALQWARIIVGPDAPVGLIDTENRSAAYYAPTPGDDVQRMNWWDPPYDFLHLPVRAPYDPRKLALMIDAAADDLAPDGCLIIDSLTHYWHGEGGTLDIVEDAGQREGGGNRFAGWKEGTPAQRHMLDTIIHAPFHVIVTMRSKMEYTLTEYTDKQGRTRRKPEKVGMAPEQRAGVEYEFTVVADMEVPTHRLIVSKSRCSLISDLVVDPGRSHEPAQTFRDWLGSGVERITASAAETIVAMFDSIDDEQQRRATKAAFVDAFGRPHEILTTQVDAAYEWLGKALGEPVQPPLDAATEPEEAAEPPEAPTSPEPAPDASDSAQDSSESDDTADPAPEPPKPPRKRSAAKKAAAKGDPKPVSGALADAIADSDE